MFLLYRSLKIRIVLQNKRVFVFTLLLILFLFNFVLYPFIMKQTRQKLVVGINLLVLKVKRFVMHLFERFVQLKFFAKTKNILIFYVCNFRFLY